jgi:hypothetical protein
MNKLIAIGILVSGLGVGGWSGYQLGSVGTDEPPAKADAPALTKLVPGLSPGRADVDSAALRVLIREEMTAALARAGSSLPPPQGKSGAAAPASTPVQETASPEVQAQRREALEQVNAMVVQGTWGNEQRMSFQEKLSMLDPQQRDQAMQRFATAINSGSLTVTTDGPPL